MKTRLVQIGNSRGIRIPKPMIEEAGLSDEVELRLQKGAIVVMPVRSPRSGWSEAARLLRERGEDYLVDPPIPTHFDDEEWEW
ncbi:MAG: AbrB/MazE/SpoVT family DNA-binding domain-containing protein [Thermoleophilia bacterium]